MSLIIKDGLRRTVKGGTKEELSQSLRWDKRRV